MKRTLLKIVILPSLVGATAFAQGLNVPDKSSKRILSDDENIAIDTEYKALYEQLMMQKDSSSSENQKLREKIRKLEEEKYSTQAGYSVPVNSPSDIGKKLGETKGNTKSKKRKSVSTGYKTATGMKVFAVTEDDDEGGTVLPAGAWVRAKLMTGVQANSKYAYNVLLQLDYAYTGPNGSKIPLNGCLMLGGATADLSIERAIIAPHTLSCVRSDGEYVQRKVTGFVAGKDSSIGLQGIVDTKQDRVFLAAALAGIVKGASQAYEIANMSQTLGGSENAQVATNFKGEFEKLAVAKGIGNAAEMTTQWYLEQAKALLPTINTGSGQDVWIVMGDSVEVPALDSDY